MKTNTRKETLQLSMGLAPLHLQDFQMGMYIKAGVYYYMSGNFVLIFRNRILDKDLLDKLIRVSLNTGELYVEVEYAEGIIHQAAIFREIQEKNEKAMAYHTLSASSIALIDDVKNTGSINQEEVTSIVAQLENRLQHLPNSSILQCINNLREKDTYLYHHSLNVGLLNGLLGRWLGLSNDVCHDLIQGGFLHDIGKLKVPQDILNKPGKLTPAEFELIKRHAVYSYETLRNAGEKNNTILQCALHHHERIRGGGYPDGLQLESIALAARITAIADVYDAMVAKRCYKEAHSPFEVLAEFAEEKFSQLDLSIVNVFLEKMPSELIGHDVLLSNGTIATVQYVPENNLAWPIVSYDDTIIQTNDTLKCVCMCG